MSKKLYEFTALIKCAIVIAADSKSQAREEVETYERRWFKVGEFVGVSDVELIDVRKPKSSDLEDEAHVVVKA